MAQTNELQDYDAQAAQTAIIHLSGKCPLPVSKEKLCSLLFLADRSRLLRFGRPISGDDYEATAGGPVPVKTVQFLSEIEVKADYEPALSVGWEGRASGGLGFAA